MKIICTTSNKYLHLIPVFTYLFQKYWPDAANTDVEIIGYDKPSCELPENFTFHSMGVQGDVSEWSTDLRKYFESIKDEWVLWFMEDSLIKQPINEPQFDTACAYMMPGVGRINLTNDISKREHLKDPAGMLIAGAHTKYRLSTQPSIWNKEFLLLYLTDGLTPWQFEVQDAFDPKWAVVGVSEPALVVNEGVRRFDPHKLDLNGMDPVDIDHINKLLGND